LSSKIIAFFKGNAKVNSNPVYQKILYSKKIPNLKHQITNKYQISIFNDQNEHHSFITSLHSFWSAGVDAIGTNLEGLCVWNFEFGHWDLFEIWFLVLGIFIEIRQLLA
jgi:hypothetical protein